MLSPGIETKTKMLLPNKMGIEKYDSKREVNTPEKPNRHLRRSSRTLRVRPIEHIIIKTKGEEKIIYRYTIQQKTKGRLKT